MEKATLRDINIAGKRVLVRVDFNVPLEEQTRTITDDSRIRAALPTIHFLIEQGARIVLLSHLGRPKGKVVEELRTAVVARRLAQILGKQVAIASDCVGSEVEKLASSLQNGDVLLLENVRFHSEEEAGDVTFAQSLARLGEIFVNDAFGTSHRAHASVSVIASYLPAVAGFLLEREINTLGGILENPAHPFVALLGGAKVSDKVGMLDNIMWKVDSLLVGGGMAATFLKAHSHNVGLSLVEEDKIETASRLMKEAAECDVRIILPEDVCVAEEIAPGANVEIVSVDDIPADKRIVDIGPQSIALFSQELRKSKTVFWNGPVGIEEIPQFAQGTRAIARLLAETNATTVIGGGSTAEVIHRMGLTDKMTFVSTGGGASLKFLGGEKMPGVEALLDRGQAQSSAQEK